MDIYSIIIIVLSIICICMIMYLLSNKNQIETFETTPTCGYTYDSDESASVRLKNCLSTQSNGQLVCNIRDCLDKAQINSKVLAGSGSDSACMDNKGFTKCTATTDDFSSTDTIQDCFNTCKDNTCDGCHGTFKIAGPRGPIEGKYTGIINEYIQKCDNDPKNHRFCTPCIDKCYNCTDSTKCKWLKPPDDESSTIFSNTPFNIRAIPDDSIITIFWDEPIKSLTHSYEVFIYEKPPKGSDFNDGSIIIRKESITTIKDGENTFTVNGLTNGVTYSININKIANTNVTNDDGLTAIKVSNTLNVVPSKVNILNFSDAVNSNTETDTEPLSVGLMSDLRGKTFDITF